MSTPLGKTAYILSLLQCAPSGDPIVDENDRRMCGVLVDGVLCGHALKVSTPNQFHVFVAHMKDKHGLTHEAYVDEFNEKKKEQNRALWTRAASDSSRSAGFVDWAVQYGVPLHAFSDWKWKMICDGAKGYALASGEVSFRNAVRERATAIDSATRTLLQKRQVTVAIDGGTTWSRSVVAFVVLCRLPNETLARPMSMVVRKEGTAEALATICRSVLKPLAEFSTIVALVTDNAAALVSAAKDVAIELGATNLPCLVHCLQLEIRSRLMVENRVQEALTVGATSDAWRTPCATRWWSSVVSLERARARGEEGGLDPAGLLAIDAVLSTLVELRRGGRLLEADSCTLPHGLALWFALCRVPGAGAPFVVGMRDRLFRTMNPHFALCAVLSPHVDWRKAEFGHRTLADEFAPELAKMMRNTKPEFIASVGRELEHWFAMEEQDRFADDELDGLWGSDAARAVGALAEAHRMLCKIVPSEAACERLFSLRKQVHTASRNRLDETLIGAECTIRAEATHESQRRKRQRQADEEDSDPDVTTAGGFDKWRSQLLPHDDACALLKLYMLRKAYNALKVDDVIVMANARREREYTVKKINVQNLFQIEVEGRDPIVIADPLAPAWRTKGR